MNELQDNKSAIQTPGEERAPRTRSLRLEEQNEEQSDRVERVREWLQHEGTEMNRQGHQIIYNLVAMVTYLDFNLNTIGGH